MADRVPAAVRSRIMRSIRGTDTVPELRVRSALHRRGFRFRVHVRELAGRPDIVLPRYRTAILVHGCFWHRHARCRFATVPQTRQSYWAAKFEANRKRDRRTVRALERAGWRVVVLWECEVMRDVHRAIVRAGLRRLPGPRRRSRLH